MVLLRSAPTVRDCCWRGGTPYTHTHTLSTCCRQTFLHWSGSGPGLGPVPVLGPIPVPSPGSGRGCGPVPVPVPSSGNGPGFGPGPGSGSGPVPGPIPDPGQWKRATSRNVSMSLKDTASFGGAPTVHQRSEDDSDIQI